MLRRENGGSDGLYGVYDNDFGDDSDGDVVGDDDDDTFMNLFTSHLFNMRQLSVQDQFVIKHCTFPFVTGDQSQRKDPRWVEDLYGSSWIYYIIIVFLSLLPLASGSSR